MSVTPAPVWPPRTPDERRRIAVASQVAHLMAAPEGTRYAHAYGVLAGLVVSRTQDVREMWAPEFAHEVEQAMAGQPFNHRVAAS